MDAKGHADEERLLYRVESVTSNTSREDETEYELDELLDDDSTHISFATTRAPRWLRAPLSRARRRAGSASSFFFFKAAVPRRRRSLPCRILHLAALAPYILVSLIVFCGIFFPSYTHPPIRYTELRHRVQELGQTANVNNEKVYIAASLYDKDGALLSGQWGQSVLHLIEILGPQNVFLSIYENDANGAALAALDSFRKNVTCESAIVTEDLDLAPLPHVSTPDGTRRLKRIAYLAEVRNRALRPLEDIKSPAHSIRFDKLLYLNDVIFDPIDAANLLFSTKADETTGKTNYRAACAVDFIMPFKFYDTFATRDLEGYDMGVPFYPWFTGAGKGESRRDVIEQRDAVRVKSCWGGMVAFDAKWFQRETESNDQRETVAFQQSPKAQAAHVDNHHGLRDSMDNDHSRAWNSSSSLRFRAETDTYWDGSECCLIHADLAAIDPESLPVNETGIYMNPYVRVAYDMSVFPWLSFTKRFERLYPPIHTIVNWIGRRPGHNQRQFEEPGQAVTDWVWQWDDEYLAAIRAGKPVPDGVHGQFQPVQRTALPGGFCGMRSLLYINEDPSNGEGKWGFDKIPTAVS